jgi:hypothetical protein
MRDKKEPRPPDIDGVPWATRDGVDVIDSLHVDTTTSELGILKDLLIAPLFAPTPAVSPELTAVGAYRDCQPPWSSAN